MVSKTLPSIPPDPNADRSARLRLRSRGAAGGVRESATKRRSAKRVGCRGIPFGIIYVNEGGVGCAGHMHDARCRCKHLKVCNITKFQSQKSRVGSELGQRMAGAMTKRDNKNWDDSSALEQGLQMKSAITIALLGLQGFDSEQPTLQDEPANNASTLYEATKTQANARGNAFTTNQEKTSYTKTTLQRKQLFHTRSQLLEY